jgi:hypothetical protein
LEVVAAVADPREVLFPWTGAFLGGGSGDEDAVDGAFISLDDRRGAFESA